MWVKYFLLEKKNSIDFALQSHQQKENYLSYSNDEKNSLKFVAQKQAVYNTNYIDVNSFPEVNLNSIPAQNIQQLQNDKSSFDKISLRKQLKATSPKLNQIADQFLSILTMFNCDDKTLNRSK